MHDFLAIIGSHLGFWDLCYWVKYFYPATGFSNPENYTLDTKIIKINWLVTDLWQSAFQHMGCVWLPWTINVTTPAVDQQSLKTVLKPSNTVFIDLPFKELYAGIFYPQISTKSAIKMNLDCMFHNGMDPYATVGAVLHVPKKRAVNQILWLILRCFKYYMNFMLVIIDKKNLMIVVHLVDIFKYFW